MGVIGSLNLDGCTFDPQHYEALLKKWKQSKNEYIWMHEVRYILKTGANWCGPIKKFHLEIKPDNPGDLIILEGNYPMKLLGNGTCVIDLENFKPTQDLRVCIIPIPSLGEDDQKHFDFSISGAWQKVKKWLCLSVPGAK